MSEISTRWLLFKCALLMCTIAAGCKSAAPATYTPITEPLTPTGMVVASTSAPTATYTSTSLPPTATPIMPLKNTSTPVPPTPQVVASPSDTPTATAIPSVTPAPATLQPPGVTLVPGAAGSGLSVSPGGGAGGEVKVYYAMPSGTGSGSKGCNYIVVGIGTGVPRSKDVAKDAEKALAMLFANNQENFGSLYNPVARSAIRVSSVEFDSNSGLITVQLTGTYQRTKIKCENNLVKAQIWQTVKQFPQVEFTNIYLNRVPFGDLVSNDG